MTRQEWITRAHTDIQTAAMSLGTDFFKESAPKLVQWVEATTRLQQPPENTISVELFKAALLWQASAVVGHAYEMTAAGWLDDFYTTLRRIDP